MEIACEWTCGRSFWANGEFELPALYQEAVLQRILAWNWLAVNREIVRHHPACRRTALIGFKVMACGRDGALSSLLPQTVAQFDGEVVSLLTESNRGINPAA